MCQNHPRHYHLSPLLHHSLTRGRHRGPGNKSTRLYSTFFSLDYLILSSRPLRAFVLLPRLGRRYRVWIWVRRVVLIWRLVHYFVLINPMMSLRMMSFRWMTMRHCRCLTMKSYWCYFFATRCRHPAAALLAFGCVPVKAKPGNSHHFRTALLRQGTD